MASAAMTLRVAGPGECALPEVTVATETTGPEQGCYYDPVDTELEIEVCECLWIGVYNDTAGEAGATQQFDGFLAIDTTGGIHNGEWTKYWAQYKPPLVPNADENIYTGTEENVYGDGSLLLDMWILGLSEASATAYNGIGVLDAKEFHCTEVGDVVVHLLDDGMQIVDSIVIHQIPEPMTIALLGLGGLFLRRRK